MKRSVYIFNWNLKESLHPIYVVKLVHTAIEIGEDLYFTVYVVSSGNVEMKLLILTTFDSQADC